MKRYLYLTACLLTATPFVAQSADPLVLARDGATDYQVVVPDSSPTEDINALLFDAGELIGNAFAANGAELTVTSESERDPARPAIYLGDTRFARAQGVPIDQFEGWTYAHKVVGRDVIIAGHDVPNPAQVAEKVTRRGQPIRGARMATVKGVSDFLRRYAGTRILYPEGETGITFLEQPVIAVPAGLDRVVEPRLRFNNARTYGRYGATPPLTAGRDLYGIANNFFPITDLDWKVHSYDRAIPVEDYAESHPEYFAMVSSGRRIVELKGEQRQCHYCISNPEVQELIYQDVLRWLDRGYDMTVLGQQDGFRPCQCEKCHALYDTGDDWGEKLWILHRGLAERLMTDRPGKKVMILSYGHTWYPPKTFNAFPENTIVLLCRVLDEWKAMKVPGGFAGYLYTWGAYSAPAYTPKSTPVMTARLAKKFADWNLQCLYLDGFGQDHGLEGPSYYVFGRMFDDPEHLEAKDLLEEYIEGAFRETSMAMRRFFDTLYHSVQLYVDMPRSYTDAYDRTRSFIRGDPMRILRVMYPAEVIRELESHLAQAEAMAVHDKVKSRLALVRLEFDYLKHVVTVGHLEQAYLFDPTEDSRERLLAAVDAWNAFLGPHWFRWDEERNGYTSGQHAGQIPGWPEHRVFLGHSRHAVALTRNRHGAAYEDTALNWDTEQVRKSPLPPSAGVAGGGVRDEQDLEGDWGALYVPEENPVTARRKQLYEETYKMPPAWKDLPDRLPDPFTTWHFREDPADHGVDRKWYAADAKATGWLEMEVPAFWAETLVGDYTGHGWYRTTFTLPAEWAGRGVRLHFGAVDEEAWIYVNGQPVGERTEASTGLSMLQLWDAPFTIEVDPEHLDYGGENQLTVRVLNSKANGGIWRPVWISASGGR